MNKSISVVAIAVMFWVSYAQAGTRLEKGLHPVQERSRDLYQKVSDLLSKFRANEMKYLVAQAEIRMWERDREQSGVYRQKQIMDLEGMASDARREARSIEKELQNTLNLAAQKKIYSEKVCSELEGLKSRSVDTTIYEGTGLLPPEPKGGPALKTSAFAHYQRTMCPNILSLMNAEKSIKSVAIAGERGQPIRDEVETSRGDGASPAPTQEEVENAK